MRSFSFFSKAFVLGWVIFPLFFFHPVFKIDNTIPDDVNQVDQMNGVLREIGDLLRENPAYLRDNWGLLYGPSGKVDQSVFSFLEDHCTDLNRGINNLNQDRFARARTYLTRRYNGYIREVKPGVNLGISLPADEEERILYALFRYNRAIMNAGLSENNSANGRADTNLMRQMLFDFRRTIAALEWLGARGETPSYYWGVGANVWEGYSLQPEHGDLAGHRVYTNLAVSYIRVGDNRGYPFSSKSYLDREWTKYSYGDNDTLGPILNKLFGVLRDQGENINRRLYRLTMALHNLEAASRGLTGEEGDEDIFYYTIALVLNHLTDFDESGITLAEAARYFKTAQQYSEPGKPIYSLAQKELILIFLRQDRYDDAAKLLTQIDLTELKQALSGPEKTMMRIFEDLTRFRELSEGKIDDVIAYFQRRDLEIREEKERMLHNRIANSLGRAYFTAVKRKLSGNFAALGAYNAQMERDEDLKNSKAFYEGYREAMTGPRHNPLIALNQWMCENPGNHRLIRLAGLAAFLLFLLYHAWFYHAHREAAKRALLSEYGSELM